MGTWDIYERTRSRNEEEEESRQIFQAQMSKPIRALGPILYDIRIGLSKGGGYEQQGES